MSNDLFGNLGFGGGKGGGFPGFPGGFGAGKDGGNGRGGSGEAGGNGNRPLPKIKFKKPEQSLFFHSVFIDTRANLCVP